MEKALIRPRELYAFKRSDRVVVPAVALSNTLWDRIPADGTPVYRPAPEGETWARTLDRETGARRGLIAVFPRPGIHVPRSKLIPQLRRAIREAERLGVPEQGEDAMNALRDLMEEPLILNSVPDSGIIMPWARYVTGENLHTCPARDCRADVILNAASRMRAHNKKTGAPCPRSNTALSEEERQNEQ